MNSKTLLVLTIALSWLPWTTLVAKPAPIRSVPKVAITPCAPGVVYVQFKLGSSVPTGITTKGEIAQSISASAFVQATRLLGLKAIIQFDAHASKDSISHALGIDRIYCIYYSNRSIEPHAALAMLEATGEVECGSVRYLFPVSSQPNDPDLSQQYALVKMNVLNAWKHTTGDTSILIADVDCAINIDHEDLKNAVQINWGETGLDAQLHDKRSNKIDDDHDGYVDNWEGWDVAGDVNISAGAQLQPNNDPRPREAAASHGTHTAGCILASGNNGLGIAGVAYGCRLLPIKAAGSDNNNIGAGYEGIHYASTHGARIINCSWGGPIAYTDTGLANRFLREVHAHGALLVVAAGNNFASNDLYPEYPANGPYVLSVGATDQTDAAASYSDFGHSVLVWAPGTSILSCDYPGNSAYSAEDGTSFASPNAAGVAGLVASKYPSWPPEFIARQLIQTVDNVVNPSDRSNYWGRLNADSALTTPPWPGLVIVSYSIDGKPSDSLGAPGVQEDLNVAFKNVIVSGTGITAKLIPELGYSCDTTPVSLGSMAEDATISGNFHITRSGVYSQGYLTLQFFVTDGNRLADTLSLTLPLSQIAGFVPDIPGIQGSSIRRVSNTVAWAAFGYTNPNTGAVQGQYANESGGVWNDTIMLNDGTQSPYDVEAYDSLNAFFGTGNANVASVISTNDGGITFNSFDVSTFTPFVNSIHFFDPLNGILIGDPKSSRWGIGITTDGGKTWNKLAKPVTAAGSIASWNNATAWVGDNGWFGTNSQQIWRSTDRGQSWKSVRTTGNQNSLGLGFDDDATHGMACFRPAGSSGGGSASGANGIMVTSDSGAVWSQLTTLPAPGISPASVRFIPHTHIAILSSNLGVYRTSDLGATWTPIGIPVSFNPDASELSISRGNGEFVVSVNSPYDGIASYTEAMPDDTTASVSAPAMLELSFDVNPNPVSGSATLTFVLPQSERIDISLYNALGQKLETISERQFNAGINSVRANVQSLDAGTYYVQIQGSSGSHITRLLTVLR